MKEEEEAKMKKKKHDSIHTIFAIITDINPISRAHQDYYSEIAAHYIDFFGD